MEFLIKIACTLFVALLSAIGTIVCSVFAMAGMHDTAPAQPTVPTIIQVPAPTPPLAVPVPDDRAKTPRRRILPLREESPLVGAPAMAQIGGPISPDGSEKVQIDIQPHLRKKNIGGSDGAGLCVFDSIAHDAKAQGVICLYDLLERMSKFPGGGYPSKVDQYLQKFCPDIKGRYLQSENPDLEFLEAVLASGRPAGVTYDGVYDPHYRKHIEHMVSLVHMTKKWACVLDNNFIMDKELVWMSPETFFHMHTAGRTRRGWAVVLLAPGQLPMLRSNQEAP